MASGAPTGMQLSLLDPVVKLPPAVPAARAGQLADLLEHHARQVSHLIDELARAEAQWLEFANVTNGASLPASLSMIERIDRLRGTMVVELHRAATLTGELTAPPPGKVTMTLRDNANAAVVLAPRLRRDPEAG